MSRLIQGMRRDINKTARTENGAITNESTLNDVLDLFYHLSARRGKDNTQLFAQAYTQDPIASVLIAFYARDARKGQGERKSFRDILKWLYVNDRAVFNVIVQFVPEYARWDDILTFTESTVVRDLVVNQLRYDIDHDKPSLLAKWMPSVNAGKKSKLLARRWITILRSNAVLHDFWIKYGDDYKNLYKNLYKNPYKATYGSDVHVDKIYRRLLKHLRNKISTIVETKMSRNEWTAIDYSTVASKASVIYRKAFGKHDYKRYSEYLAAVKRGEKTINASVLYPYEIVSKVSNGEYSQTLEALWNALPNYANDDSNGLVVCDVSGSMASTLHNSTVSAMDVAISLAMYIAERNKGLFKDHFITFSTNPRLQRVTGNTLYDKVNNLRRADWGTSTDIQAVMRLILRTAVENNLDQEDMPDTLYIISDMEFNQATSNNTQTNFEAMCAKFIAAGYKPPRFVFWNVISKNSQTPITVDDKGVYLVSGHSPSIYRSVVSTNAVNALGLMNEVIYSDRYTQIAEVLKRVVKV